jgi:hypothetical protein
MLIKNPTSFFNIEVKIEQKLYHRELMFTNLGNQKRFFDSFIKFTKFLNFIKGGLVLSQKNLNLCH